MIKAQISQLIQDVHDFKESAIKATEVIQDLERYLNKCKKEIEDLVIIENERIHKNNNPT